MKRRPLRAGLLVMAFVVGAAAGASCGSYEDDLYKICHAPRLSGAPPDSGLAGSAEWLQKNLSTRKGKELLERIASQASVDVLRAEMAANGIAPCPLLDPR